MTSILDVPFDCLPFTVLIQLRGLSRECYARSEEALSAKDTGTELCSYFKTVRWQLRYSKIVYRLPNIDVWNMWRFIGNQAVGSCQTRSFMVMAVMPCTIVINTNYMCDTTQIEISSQQTVGVRYPYLALPSPVTATLYDQVDAWNYFMGTLVDEKDYTSVWWYTHPLTLFEIDLACNMYYKYEGITVYNIHGCTRISIPYERVIEPNTRAMRYYLSVILDYF